MLMSLDLKPLSQEGLFIIALQSTSIVSEKQILTLILSKIKWSIHKTQDAPTLSLIALAPN